MTKFQQLQARAELAEAQAAHYKAYGEHMKERERRDHVARRRDMLASAIVLAILSGSGIALMYGFMDFVQWLLT
jgi:hypothetical protein